MPASKGEAESKIIRPNVESSSADPAFLGDVTYKLVPEAVSWNRRFQIEMES